MLRIGHFRTPIPAHAEVMVWCLVSEVVWRQNATTFNNTIIAPRPQFPSVVCYVAAQVQKTTPALRVKATIPLLRRGVGGADGVVLWTFAGR